MGSASPTAPSARNRRRPSAVAATRLAASRRGAPVARNALRAHAAAGRAVLPALPAPDPCAKRSPAAFEPRRAGRSPIRGGGQGLRHAALRNGPSTFTAGFANRDLATRPACVEAGQARVRAACGAAGPHRRFPRSTRVPRERRRQAGAPPPSVRRDEAGLGGSALGALRRPERVPRSDAAGLRQPADGAWNKLGPSPLPKFRSGDGLGVRVAFLACVDSTPADGESKQLSRALAHGGVLNRFPADRDRDGLIARATHRKERRFQAGLRPCRQPDRASDAAAFAVSFARRSNRPAPPGAACGPAPKAVRRCRRPASGRPSALR